MSGRPTQQLTRATRLTIGTKVGHRRLPERLLDVRQPDVKRLHGASRVDAFLPA